ncbi:MAG TPA: GGDEF domain-containing protein [Acidobacteriaceae bacterium]|nr:GGDEF domain-containing protein [Acidobacteriaceae bacterium]
MNISFFPDLFSLAMLIVILAMVRRSHSDARGDAWLLGLSFTLGESIAHTFYPRQGVPAALLHIAVLDCYLFAGLVFNWAAGDQRQPRRTRLLYLLLNGLGLTIITTIYGLNLRYTAIYIPAIALGATISIASSIFIRRNWYYAGLFACGWTAIAVLVAQHNYRSAIYWSLGCVYAMAALNFERRLERRSTGKIAIVVGFSIWALFFFTHPWITDHYAAHADIASHVWNMQKTLISIGMILMMLEEQVTNNEWLALHDELTGLPNRRLFAARLSSAVDRAERSNTSLALVVLDLNDFKQINDSLGHVAGDQVLREVSSVLRKNIRTGDTVARLGGDEFIIVVADMPNPSAVERFTDSLRSAIQRPMMIHDKQLEVGASFGFAMYPDDAKDATKLLRLADQRMYFLKKRPVRTARLESEMVAQAQ